MTIAHKPLGLVKMLAESLGLDITYSYDDLVFVSHDHFLFRFPEKSDELALHFNVECPQAAREELDRHIREAALAQGLHLVRQGDYALTADKENQTVSVAFV